jgi:hypothetical protein
MQPPFVRRLDDHPARVRPRHRRGYASEPAWKFDRTLTQSARHRRDGPGIRIHPSIRNIQMEFDTFIAQAWDDHVRDPQGVADRLDDCKPLVANEQQFIRLADIVHHVYGDHLNDRRAGLAAIDELTRLQAYREAGPSGAAVRRFIASLRLSEGEAGVLDAFEASDQIRIVALAVSNLTDVDPARAALLFHEALRLVEASGLPSSDPMHGDLALQAHNLAAGIERDPDPSDDDLALMVLAARTAHHHWGVLGRASDIFSGQVRLASALRKSGDLVAAHAAARDGVSLASADGGTTLQRFLAWHILGLIERDAANRSAFEDAAKTALAAYAELGPADQARQAAKRAQLIGR